MQGIYRQRRPEKTTFYQILTTYWLEFRLKYNELYGEKYGFYRTEIDRECEKYRKCGIPKYGVAKIKCETPGCDEQYFLPFSCHGRGVCPSCQQKNMLETGMFLGDEIFLEVPHRHFVFTIPKLLRKNFYWHRECLNDLSRLAWGVTLTFMRETLQLDGVPGSVQAIETCGQYLENNPHIHAITTDGLWTADGVFHPMPRYDEGARLYIQSLWEKAVAQFCISKGFVTPNMMQNVLHWRHTGFSVYTDRVVDYRKSDEKTVAELSHLARYIAKPHFSLENIRYAEGGEYVLYRGDMYNVQWERRADGRQSRRPRPYRDSNFEVFKPLDFLAAVTSHIPNFRQKLINLYGVYSNRHRGEQKKITARNEPESRASEEVSTEKQKKYKRTWAMLIRMVWEVDPLVCSKCHGRMRVVAIMVQAEVVEKSLRHAGLWEDLLIRSHGEQERGPPAGDELAPVAGELTYEPFEAPP